MLQVIPESRQEGREGEEQVIYSPLEMKVSSPETGRSRIVRGALLMKGELAKVVKLIDRNNSNGLKGNDAILLMRLKEALAGL